MRLVSEKRSTWRICRHAIKRRRRHFVSHDRSLKEFYGLKFRVLNRQSAFTLLLNWLINLEIFSPRPSFTENRSEKFQTEILNPKSRKFVASECLLIYSQQSRSHSVVWLNSNVSNWITQTNIQNQFVSVAHIVNQLTSVLGTGRIDNSTARVEMKLWQTIDFSAALPCMFLLILCHAKKH